MRKLRYTDTFARVGSFQSRRASASHGSSPVFDTPQRPTTRGLYLAHLLLSLPRETVKNAEPAYVTWLPCLEPLRPPYYKRLSMDQSVEASRT